MNEWCLTLIVHCYVLMQMCSKLILDLNRETYVLQYAIVLN